MEAAGALFRAASGAKNRILENRLEVGGSEWLLGEVGWGGRSFGHGHSKPAGLRSLREPACHWWDARHGVAVE